MKTKRQPHSISWCFSCAASRWWLSSRWNVHRRWFSLFKMCRPLLTICVSL